MRTFLLAVSLGLCSATLFAESAAGLKWTTPPGWVNQGTSMMRAATYQVAPAAGDRDAAECGVFFFGPGQGGSVEANVARWKSQFAKADGTPAVAKLATRTLRGLKITTLDVAGSYSGMGGPMAANPRSAPGYRLLGAIVEGPGGNLFVKFTGPEKTIAANQQKFEQLLTSLQSDK